MTYTDADVQRLVKAARRVADPEIVGRDTYSPRIQANTALTNALAPFQPDPEAELVEDITVTMHEVADGHGFMCKPDFCPRCQRQAQAALACVKMAGWTPPPRR